MDLRTVIGAACWFECVYGTGDDNVKQLFYATVHCLMMGRWGPKHVTVDVLKHYCDSDELCAFVGLHVVTES